MKVIEPATRENFCAPGYLRMNADVAACNPEGGDPWAWQHFSEHGEREGRQQISAVFIDEEQTYGKTKFARFKSLLLGEAVNGSGAANFKFLVHSDRCPIAFSDRHFSRDDYVVESSNAAYGPFVEEITANPDRLYLDLGCGLRKEVYDNCLYLEVYPSLTTDVVVEPNCTYPIRPDSLDGIGCFAVLEHTTRPWEVVAEIRRMLKPGGKAFIDWPFLQPVHGYPSHYYNATREGLKLMFANGFDIEYCRTEPSQTPDFTIWWILGQFLERLPAADKERVRQMSVADLVSQAPMGAFWTDLLKKLPDNAISEFACGNTLVARKK